MTTPTPEAPRGVNRGWKWLLGAALSLSAGGWVMGGGSEASSPPGLTPSNPAVMWRDFVRAYWRPGAGLFCTYSDCQTRPDRSSGPGGGLYSDFWWAAQLYDLALDAAEWYPQAGGPTLAQVRAGFNHAYDPALNDYNDDLGWLAQAALRAYALSGDPGDLAQGRALADRIWEGWDSTYGGGVWWHRSQHDQKNVATNAPLVSTNLAIYRATSDRTYLERAQQGWAWLQSRLIDGPRVYDHISGPGDGEITRWDFTYNFGTVMDAGLSMAGFGSDPQAAGVARRTADWALKNLTQNGVLLDEGGGDGGGFKGVFVRALRRLATLPGGEVYRAALNRQGQSAWNARRGDGLTGTAWDARPGDGPIESLAAASAVAAVLGAGPQPAGVPFTDGRYEAENAQKLGVDSSDRAPDHSGRGYVNNFRSFGQGVAFAVNVPEAGTYQVTLRYSAGGGWASRRLIVNGAARGVNLPATPDWRTWTTVRVPVTLPAGSSALQIFFGPDDAGWVNLDRLTLDGPTPEAP